MKYAVIIKHPYRDNDYRIDIIDIDEEQWSREQLERQLYKEMLGPFEIVAITSKISLDRKFPYLPIIDKEVEL